MGAPTGYDYHHLEDQQRSVASEGRLEFERNDSPLSKSKSVVDLACGNYKIVDMIMRELSLQECLRAVDSENAADESLQVNHKHSFLSAEGLHDIQSQHYDGVMLDRPS